MILQMPISRANGLNAFENLPMDRQGPSLFAGQRAIVTLEYLEVDAFGTQALREREPTALYVSNGTRRSGESAYPSPAPTISTVGFDMLYMLRVDGCRNGDYFSSGHPKSYSTAISGLRVSQEYIAVRALVLRNT